MRRLLLLTVCALPLLALSCRSTAPATSEPPATEPSAGSTSSVLAPLPIPPTTQTALPTKQGLVAAPFDGQLLSGRHSVILHTSKGDISLSLNADLAPMAVTNFVGLSESGYYNNLTFHRVIPGFMIQGGDPNGNGTGGRSIFGPAFKDEVTLTAPEYKAGYVQGVVAMANSGSNTNGSQFFIMENDYPLSPNYTIFGKVTAGQDVVEAIASVPVDRRDKPLEPVTFTVEVVD